MAKQSGKRQQAIPTVERIKKMQARDISRLKDETLRQLSKEAYEALATRAISLFNKRMAQIEKKGLSQYAFAQNKYIADIDLSSTPSRASAARQVAAIRNFFGAKTSTAAGIQKMLSKEESRLSNLAQTKIEFASEEERKRFWSAYQEFMNQNPEYDNMQGSDRVQQYLAESTFWKTRGFNADDLAEVLTKAKERGSRNVTVRSRRRFRF